MISSNIFNITRSTTTPVISDRCRKAFVAKKKSFAGRRLRLARAKSEAKISRGYW